MVAQLKPAIGIAVDNEFREWLTPLTEDERGRLERSLQDEGCRDALVVWPSPDGRIVMDGHNRYEICGNLNIKYDVIERQFESREAAKNWIIENQLGKRNITAEARSYLIGKLYNQQKKSKVSNLRQFASKGQSDTSVSASAKLAKENKVGVATVKRAAKFAAAVDAVATNTGKDIKRKILSREIESKQRDIQELASRSEPEQREVIEKVESGQAKTVGKAIIQVDKEKRVKESASVVLPEDCRVISSLDELIAEGAAFTTIYADPPWTFNNQATRASTSNHYSNMTIEDICALPVAQIARKNAHLHLWITKDHLFEGQRVLEAWGFKFKSIFVWTKPDIGMGNYWRMATEFMLLGVRGKLGFQDRGQRNWDELPTGEHSEKPEEIRRKIQKVSPGPYIELFARTAVPGWTSFGNEVLIPGDNKKFQRPEGPLFNGE